MWPFQGSRLGRDCWECRVWDVDLGEGLDEVCLAYGMFAAARAYNVSEQQAIP